MSGTMSTSQSHPSPATQQSPHPQQQGIYQYGNPMLYPTQQGQQYNQGGPGPSTMQQMQQQMMQANPAFQQQGLGPHQMAALQSIQRGPSQQQQLQMLQQAASGPQGAQAQAFLNAMRNQHFQVRPGPPPQSNGPLQPTRMQQFQQQPDVARVQMQQAIPRQGSPVNPPSASPRQPSYGSQNNMPPPPLPTTTPTQPGHARFTPSPTQLQHIALAQQKIIADPGFQSMPSAQQQIQLNMVNHRMMSMFAQQTAAPSPSHLQQSLPNGQPPFSSLPSHMAPRPTSAASQRAPSPRQSTPGPARPQSPAVHTSTPPPNQQYPITASPAGSHQSIHHTPNHQPAASPQQPPPSSQSGNQAGQNHNPAPPGSVPPPFDMSGFPFDPRILGQIGNLQDPAWRQGMQLRNPAALQTVMNASMMIQQGKIAPETLSRMHKVLAWMKAEAERVRMAAQGPGTSGAASQAPAPSGPRSSMDGNAPPSAGPMPPPAWIPGSAATATTALPVQAPPAAQPTARKVSVPLSIPVKSWEAALRPSLPFTQITPLPSDPVAPLAPAPPSFDPTFSGALPTLTPTEVTDVRRWIDTDLAYLGNFEARKKQVQGKMMNWAKESDMGTPWWMVRKGESQSTTGPGIKVIWPDEKARERSRGMARASGRSRREIRFTPKQLKAMANVEDHVIPIRLDMEEGQYKLKDTFMWNCSDLFAQSLCDDFNLPPAVFIPKIVATINEKIREYKDQVMPLEPRLPSSPIGGKLEESGEEWDAWRRLREDAMRDDDDSGEEEEVRTDEGGKVDHGVIIVNGDEDEDIKPEMEDGKMEQRVDLPVTVDEAMQKWAIRDEAMGEDMRILIKVDIIIGTQNLSDTFEWDLCSPVTPEDFAIMYTQELGLNGEFATALAHDIHEQILVHKRCLFLVGHTIGSGHVQDDEVRSSFLPALSNVLRREDIAMSTYTPIFTTHTEEDVAMIEREREKDSKRKKRATRARRGIILPDREPVKTHRTLLNPLAANGLAAPKFEDMTPTLQPAHTSRRAAAIAAQANINLLAQDLPIPDKPPQSPLPPFASKRGGKGWKIGRGLSRASPAGGREGSLLPGPESHAGTPTAASAAALPPHHPLSGLKRAYRDEEEESPGARKRTQARSPEGAEDVKPVLAPVAIPSRLNGSRSRSTTSRSRTPEKPREPTPKVLLQRKRVLDDDDSDSDSSDSSDDFDERGRSKSKASKKGRTSSVHTARRPSAASSKSPTKAPTPAPVAAAGPPAPTPPEWCEAAEADTKSRYPRDHFFVVPKGKTEPGQPVEWRLRCLDCPGKIYNMGPGESFTGYEVHLRNRVHIANREKREAGE